MHPLELLKQEQWVWEKLMFRRCCRGIGSMPTHIRKAYNRRVRCSCVLEPLTIPSFTSEPIGYAQAGSTYSFTLTYSHVINNRLTTFEVLSKPSWLTLDSFDFENKIGVFSGIPQ